MKKIVVYFTSVLLYTLSFFGLTAFVMWDINPGNWSEGARFFTVLIGTIGLIPIVGLASEIS